MAKNKIAIITDSTSDIPEELRKEYDITVVPLTINWEGKSYLDGVDLSAEEFYKRLEENPVHPTTSQPAPGDFVKAYQEAKQSGAEEIVVVTISSAMSGTIESARSAAENIDIPVHIVDAKGNSMGLGWQVVAGARSRDEGGNVSAILSAIEKVRTHVHFHIVLDTMEYLFKGGRIASAAKLLNNVLKIKPQIHVNHNSGSVEASHVSRTRSKAIDALYTSFFDKVDCSKPLHITVLHNAALEEAKALAERIREEFHPVELFIAFASPVLGVHTGPHAIGICGYDEV